MGSGSASGTGGASGTEKPGKNKYKDTLNLPQTSFSMKANLVQNEPATLARWQKIGLYEKVREARKGAELFAFHDGPPYANGSIHLGHLMNKCLKDFVVRTRTMMGFDVPYVPGWDCHGLPIEHKVMTELVESGKIEKLRALSEDQRKIAVRRACQGHAEKYHALHTKQMQRLLTLADYEHPYLTLQPSYEGATLEVLAELVAQGLVYRALKPVHWSVANETALAEAELEYEDREDPSIYVDFECYDTADVFARFGLSEDDQERLNLGARPSLMIWTTTPWTLPANVAVAVNPDYRYALVRVDGNVTILAEKLIEKVTTVGKSEEVEVLATAMGEALVGMRYRHPFVSSVPACGLGHKCAEEKVWSLVAADYVTLEDGTGLVHTAPGHGTDDFKTGVREQLPVYCPVREDGTYDATVPEWLRGKSIWDANKLVIEHLRDSGHLYHWHMFTHSYPHDWRSKTPVIFRCTEQWFVGVDRATKREGKSLREMGLASLEGAGAVKFVPEWGKNRLRGMLESRPDWCISRQRAWGLPIPAFFSKDGVVLMTPASVRAVALVVREKGSDAWFTMEAKDLLSKYDYAGDPDAPRGLDLASLKKGPDILDVWFESGSSWNAVMRERGLGFPVELYLEGSDQHRGWFQSSMLPALGVVGRPPYKALLTHGFINDKDGKKLSKSRPDAKDYEVDNLLVNYGADVMRWWVSSLAYENDVKADTGFFAGAGDSYRKVRNTLRFMLSNLYDFTASIDGVEGHCVALDLIEPTSIDAWAMAQFDELSARVVEAYERYAFADAHKALYDFCNDTLSSVYLAAVKDRLYCDKADSARRRRTQTVLFEISDGLSRLLAPLLPHTADEAYRALRGATADDVTVHLRGFIREKDAWGYGVRCDEGWKTVMRVRDDALAAIERTRAAGEVENPLEMGVRLPDPDGTLARFDARDLADLLGVSRVEVGGSSIEVIDLRSENRCERSWKRDGTVRLRPDGGMLSDRDAEAVGVA
jgi:isoleucyl-tRNA synthetase